jgi:hypothetical protein
LYVDRASQPRQNAGVVGGAPPDGVVLTEDLEHEDLGVAGPQVEVRGDVAVVQLEPAGGAEPQPDLLPADQHPVVDGLGDRVLEPVARPGRQAHAHPAPASHTGDPAHQSLPVLGVVGPQERHEVLHLDHPVLGEEAGDQDGGVREVELVRAPGLVRRSDPPAAALLGVQQGTEHAG